VWVLNHTFFVPLLKKPRDSATPSAMVHFKNNKTISPEVAAALTEMILKAKAAMAADDF
jgi:hypothetical protein